MNAGAPLPPILVVDDDKTDVFFLERRLRAAGVSEPVHHVGDGLEFVEWFEHLTAVNLEDQRPWALFLDLKMPLMNGFEVLAWMQQRQLADEIAVVVLSTSDDPRDIQRALNLGAVGFLVKYPDPHELAAVMGDARRRAVERTEAGLHRFGGKIN